MKIKACFVIYSDLIFNFELLRNDRSLVRLKYNAWRFFSIFSLVLVIEMVRSAL